MWISESCDLDTDTLLDALYYSMITMTTIGFGTKSMTFGDCASGYFIIGLQFVVGTIMNAVLMGVLCAVAIAASAPVPRLLPPLPAAYGARRRAAG